MRKVFIVAAALAVAGSFMAACGDSDDSKEADSVTTTSAKADEAAEPLVVGAAEKGSTQTIKVGQTIQVRLELAGGTGYSWSVKSGPDTAVLKNGGTTQEKISTATTEGQILTGAPEASTTSFKAVGKGTTTFTLAFVSPAGQQEDTYSLTVVVV